jgi:hypothetical protein
LFLLVFAGGDRAWAAASTTTTLTVTSAGIAVTSVESGTVVTLTATVTAGSTAVTVGTVNFCDASAKYCTDIHLLGTAQLTMAGPAVFKFRPGIGSHSYKAVFRGTKSNADSTSSTATLTVTKFGVYTTSTTIAQSANAGSYTLTATVDGLGLLRAAPTGTVSFLDSSNGNALLGTVTLGAGTAILGFLGSSSPSATGEEPMSIAVGDFNGDGIPDLAVANKGGDDVTALLGNGDGTFTAMASLATGSADSIVVGDFNGDGIPDLVAVGRYGMAVFLGNGDGTFRAAPSSAYDYGGILPSIAVGDFNGDGILDLAGVNGGDDSVTVLLGNGDGTFTAMATSPATGGEPVSIAVGDFNGDGIRDLAVVNEGSNTVTVLLGNGDGTFTTTAASPATGSSPRYIALGDFNGDGFLDLAVANCGSDTVTVLLGNGDGTFQTAVSQAAGSEPISIAVGDFNGDGFLDLAVANYGSDTVTMLLGNGDGTFTATATSPATGIGPDSIAVGDFNGDGIPDLAVANYFRNTVTVELATNQSATATANGIVLAVATGTHLVLASYPGDSNYAASTSYTTSLTAAQGTPMVALTASANSVPYGTAVALTATVTGSGLTPTGKAIFYDGGELLGTGTLSGGVATYWTTGLLPLGLQSITASYAGDSNYVTATSAVLSLTVNQGTPNIVWPAPAPIAYGTNLSAILDATAQNGSGTTVPGTFAYTATPAGGTAATVTTATILAIGSYTLSASFTPTNTTDYTAATASVQLTVESEAQTITFPNPGTQTYGVAPITLKATASSGLAVSYKVTSGPAKVSGKTLTITGAGSVTVRATQAGNSTYSAATPVSVSFTVKPAVLTVTANNASRVYGAANPAFTYKITGFVNGDTSTVVSGTATLTSVATEASAAGTYPITFSTKKLAASNYSFTYVNGTLTIDNPVPVLIWLSPASTIPEGGGFTLTVNGSSFVRGSIVQWNGSALTTTYVSATRLQALIPDSDILIGKASVTVFNPALGGGASRALIFTIDYPVPVLMSLSPATAKHGSGNFTLTVNGFNFVKGATVRWNGSTLTTTYVSETQLRATVLASDVAKTGSASITVANPAPSLSASNAVTFTIN